MPSRDLGTQGRALLRVAGRKTGENRWVRACYHAGSVTVRSVGRVIRVLLLEVTGLFFLVLALVGGAAAVREYHRHAAGNGSTAKMLLASGFARGVRLFWGELVLEIAKKIVSGTYVMNWQESAQCARSDSCLRFRNLKLFLSKPFTL